MATRNNLCVVFTPGWGPVVGFCDQDNEQLIFISIGFFLAGWFANVTFQEKLIHMKLSIDYFVKSL
jgi:hypothetical protein